MADPARTALPFTAAASIEASPKQILELADLELLFPARTRVYLTDTGTAPAAVQIEAARRLSRAGYVAVPHIPVRRIESRAELENRLQRLALDGGVREALVIAGGVPRPAGPFASSMDALATGMFADAGITSIAVAGHPEGSPDISEDEIRKAVAWKNEFAARTGADMRIVTQFSFDPRLVIAWSRRLARSGNQLPIHVGVAGPAKITTLVKYAALCGVGASMSFLRSKGASLAVLATSYSPEGVLGPLEAHLAEEPGSAIAQVHVYPFGGLRRTAEWLSERGTWFAGTAEADAETGSETVAAEAGL
ncbi:methylenetetrahydrofolate reductase (NADPH) [Amorphus suaedae]